jgi:hypothetical protein
LSANRRTPARLVCVLRSFDTAIIFIVRVICCVLFTLRMRARILCRFVKGRQLLSAGGGNGGS